MSTSRLIPRNPVEKLISRTVIEVKMSGRDLRTVTFQELIDKILATATHTESIKHADFQNPYLRFTLANGNRIDVHALMQLAGIYWPFCKPHDA